MRMEFPNSSGSNDERPDIQSPTTSKPRPVHRTPPHQAEPAYLPSSVRGAPEELKPAIRKKQNKESARRSRRRKKELVLNLGQSIDMLVHKTQELESRLDSIEKFLAKSGYQIFSSERLQYPVINLGIYTSHEEGGPSGSGSIVLGSDAGSQSLSAPASHSASGAPPRERTSSDLDDEDISKLIDSCLEQL